MVVQQLIDQHVDGLRKGWRPRRCGRSAGFEAPFECAQIGLGHRLVVRDREEQGDVDVDLLEQPLFDSRQPGQGARDLDEQASSLSDLKITH